MKSIFRLAIVAVVAALFFRAQDPATKGLNLRSPWFQLETKWNPL